MVEQAPALRVFKIKLPMRVRTSKKKKQALNLNVYRNLHHRSLHAQKKKFEEIAKKLLRDIPPLGVITLHYEVYPQTRRRLDIMNVGSIVDKYFSDTLTDCGIIEDDDLKNIPRVSFTFGGFVKSEHILVTITEIEPRKGATPMKVLLDETDIRNALTTYVSSLNIPNASGVKLEADVEGVITAEVMFGTFAESDLPESNVPQGETPQEAAPKKRGRGGRPRGSKNKPKEDDANVDETVSTDPDVGGSGVAETPTSEASDGDPTEALDTSGKLKGEDDEKPKGTSKGNLFGDKASPSSEDDDGASDGAALDTPPAPVKESGAKKGSIFDA